MKLNFVFVIIVFYTLDLSNKLIYLTGIIHWYCPTNWKIFIAHLNCFPYFVSMCCGSRLLNLWNRQRKSLSQGLLCTKVWCWLPWLSRGSSLRPNCWRILLKVNWVYPQCKALKSISSMLCFWLSRTKLILKMMVLLGKPAIIAHLQLPLWTCHLLK